MDISQGHIPSASEALILLAHGSRDPRWAEPFAAIRARVAAALPATPVVLAYLETMQPDLAAAVSAVRDHGARGVCVVPLFLGQGGHVRDDVPRSVAELARRYPEVSLRVAGAAGEAPEVLDAIAAYCIAQGQR